MYPRIRRAATPRRIGHAVTFIKLRELFLVRPINRVLRVDVGMVKENNLAAAARKTAGRPRHRVGFVSENVCTESRSLSADPAREPLVRQMVL